MLRMQNVIYERGSAAQQRAPATGAVQERGRARAPGQGGCQGTTCSLGTQRLAKPAAFLTNSVCERGQSLGTAAAGSRLGCCLAWAVGVRGSRQLIPAAGLQLAQLISVSAHGGGCAAAFEGSTVPLSVCLSSLPAPATPGTPLKPRLCPAWFEAPFPGNHTARYFLLEEFDHVYHNSSSFLCCERCDK